MLSEKNVFENLVDTYNWIFDILQFAESIPTFIPNAVDSKTNNIILLREIYKRDASIFLFIKRIFCIHFFFVYRSPFKNFLEFGQSRIGH